MCVCIKCGALTTTEAGPGEAIPTRLLCSSAIQCFTIGAGDPSDTVKAVLALLAYDWFKSHDCYLTEESVGKEMLKVLEDARGEMRQSGADLAAIRSQK